MNPSPICSRRRLVLPLLAGAAILLSAGCAAKDPYATDFDSVASNPTPNLKGTVERPVDVDKNIALMRNENWRMFSDDLGRVFYTDHASRLSPFPITNLSSQPK